MNTTGKVSSIEGPNKGGFYTVKLGDFILSTKQEEVIQSLEAGMTISAEYTTAKKGKYTNYYLEEWTPMKTSANSPKTTNKAAEPAQPRDNVPTEGWGWEAKDRAIAAESALSSAAQFMQAVAVAHPDHVTTANWIEAGRQAYKVVQYLKQGGDPTVLAKKQEAIRGRNEQVIEAEELPF